MSARVGARLRADINEVLTARYGPGVEIDDWTEISRRLSAVLRVRVQAGGTAAPPTVIVKHVDERWYGYPRAPDCPPEFLEEVAAYDFLSSLTPTFPERPLWLGWHAHGAMLLEDLGVGDPEPLPLTEIALMVGRLLAGLHIATIGRLDLLAAKRSALGLPADRDQRDDGEEVARWRFARGVACLGDWCARLGIASEAAAEAILAQAGAVIAEPSPIDAFLHDDLANGRQCVVERGRMRLLDFENAKPGHPLRDVAKAMGGKFERDRVSRRMILMCPDFGDELVQAYREAMMGADGPWRDDGAWEAALAAAMLHGTITQVGALLELIERTQVEGHLLANLHRLLGRLETVLARKRGCPEARTLLGRLMEHIVLG